MDRDRRRRVYRTARGLSNPTPVRSGAVNTPAKDVELIRVYFGDCSPDYYELAMQARPHSQLLQRVTFLEFEAVKKSDEISMLNISLLVPRSMFDHWEAVADGTRAEYMGEQILWMEIMAVCERKGILTHEQIMG